MPSFVHENYPCARRRSSSPSPAVSGDNGENRARARSPACIDRTRKRAPAGSPRWHLAETRSAAATPRRLIVFLVDTSVWIDHLRSGDTLLASLLAKQLVLTHDFV